MLGTTKSPEFCDQSVTEDEVEDSNAEKVIFNNKIKQRRTKTTPKGKNKQAGRRLEHSQTFNSHETHERQRISTGLQTQGDYIGRQTRVTMETQLEPLKQ